MEELERLQDEYKRAKEKLAAAKTPEEARIARALLERAFNALDDYERRFDDPKRGL
jgi:hypothetical protein